MGIVNSVPDANRGQSGQHESRQLHNPSPRIATFYTNSATATLRGGARLRGAPDTLYLAERLIHQIARAAMRARDNWNIFDYQKARALAVASRHVPELNVPAAVLATNLSCQGITQTNARSRRGGTSLWDRQRKQEHGRQCVEAAKPMWVGLGDGSPQLRTITRSARAFSLRSW
jgi:hypothetical protein